jgi:hypothetical protein
MLTPTRGTITVLDQRPAAGPAQLARVGFVAQDTQDTPVYARMTVADHLRLGARRPRPRSTWPWPGTASGGSAGCLDQTGATITLAGQLAPATAAVGYP